MAGSCAHRYEHSGYIKQGEFLGCLSNHQLHSKETILWLNTHNKEYITLLNHQILIAIPHHSQDLRKNHQVMNEWSYTSTPTLTL